MGFGVWEEVSWNFEVGGEEKRNSDKAVQGQTSSLPVSLRGQFLSLAFGPGRKEGGVVEWWWWVVGGGGVVMDITDITQLPTSPSKDEPYCRSPPGRTVLSVPSIVQLLSERTSSCYLHGNRTQVPF